jgi:hypothetical protein
MKNPVTFTDDAIAYILGRARAFVTVREHPVLVEFPLFPDEKIAESLPRRGRSNRGR